MAMQVIYSAGTVTPMGSPRSSPINTPHGSPIFPGRYSPNHTPRGSPRTSPRRVKSHPTSPLTESSALLINSNHHGTHMNADLHNGHHDDHKHHHHHFCHYHHVHMPKDDNDLKNTIPTMTRSLAITCIVLNVLSPGLGTFVSGISVLCCSKVRPQGGDKINVIWVNSWIALLQFMTAFLFLLGWIWSIMWSSNFLDVARECELKAEMEKGEKPCVCSDPAVLCEIQTNLSEQSVPSCSKNSAPKTVTSLVSKNQRPSSLIRSDIPPNHMAHSNGSNCAPTIVLQAPSSYNNSPKSQNLVSTFSSLNPSMSGDDNNEHNNTSHMIVNEV